MLTDCGEVGGSVRIMGMRVDVLAVVVGAIGEEGFGELGVR